MQQPWIHEYKKHNITPEIQLPPATASVLDVLEKSFTDYSERTAFHFMGKDASYRMIETWSRYFAAYLQSLGLAKGARVAVMLPNVFQYPMAAYGILRAGFVLVNVNPLYTPRELEHQLKDSGAEVLLILENFAHVYAAIQKNVPLKKVIVSGVGDLLGFAKGLLVNMVLKYVKKQVPDYDIQGSVTFKSVMLLGAKAPYKRPVVQSADTAVLQYTGGTTGLSKGAELTHANILSNIAQADSFFDLVMDAANSEIATILCALPLYHIFAFTVCGIYGPKIGGKVILIANPRDIPALVKEVATHKPTLFPAVNTLFNALVNNEEFKLLDHSQLKLAIGGGMSVLASTAEAWQKITGKPIIEAYGLSETSPAATVNPPTNTVFTGAIGIPLPSTDILLLDDDEQPVALGDRGEISIKGPQVMKGYWNKPDETAKVMTANGYFKTGDIGVMDVNGYITIVDRKKDMILVSGFNVYPNEIEAVVTLHPKVLEAAAIGVPDEKSGEVPKLFVVKKEASLTEGELMEYLEQQLTGYKKPRYIEFMTELPKSNVGKILRKDLRDMEMKRRAS